MPVTECAIVATVLGNFFLSFLFLVVFGGGEFFFCPYNFPTRCRPPPRLTLLLKRSLLVSTCTSTILYRPVVLDQSATMCEPSYNRRYRISTNPESSPQ